MIRALELTLPSSYGVAEEINQIILSYKQKIKAYIFNQVKNEDVADDICQEVFIKVWVAKLNSTYVETNKLFSFLMRVAKNLVIDYFRASQKVHYTDVQSVENQISLRGENFDKYYLQHYFAIVEKSFIHLSESQQKVIRLRYFEGKTFMEIAETLGISVNTVLSRHYSALEVLKKYVKK